MNPVEIPNLADFLDYPIEEVRKTAPGTFIYAASGTRRAAALAGLPTQGDEFARWTQGQLFRVVELIFHHGVEHLVMPMLGPSQFHEITAEYQEYLWRWFEWGLTGPDALALYQAKGWRVRMAFCDFNPRIREAGIRLREATPQGGQHTLWCVAVPEYHLPYEWMLQAAHQSGAQTYQEAIAALYGENIPPASLYLSTGKPLLSSLQIPPLLMSGPLQGYWSQRPGYSLDEAQFRAILHDYAYLRRTWLEDKTGRAEQALAHRETWEKGLTLGVGTRLGPFWYPAPIGNENGCGAV